MAADAVSVSRVIAATPEVLFAIVADPNQHPAIDGSGTVRQAREASPTRLALGDTFGMSMHMYMPYKMVNEIVELEPDRRIAWTPRLDGPAAIARWIGPVIWRYEFEPVEGGTRVTETWDPTRSRQRSVYGPLGMAKQVGPNMERTLERLERVALGG
jgi:uncharacterized protein YndB with AHSA1/START domain